MKFFGYWTILVALSISIVAAYYSIVGLVAIFAASVIPVIVMGSVLEVGKITTAVWLHLFWGRAGFLMKSYLTIAVLLLMFITSMGIFGFLSKAHIEQNAVALEGQAQLERIITDINRGEDIIARAEQKINKLDTQDENADAGLQEKIATEEARVETVYTRLNEALQSLEDTLYDSVNPYQTQVEQAEIELAQIAEYVRDNKIRELQGLIGARQDGRYGPKTAEKVEAYRNALTVTRDTALETMTELRREAREERQRLRTNAEQVADQSVQLINRLRQQIGTASNADVEDEIEEQRVLIKQTEDQLDELFETKYEIEAEARKLEAEVGPVKYIAELIYGNETTRDSLEEAVRWVIIILVIVFDPLAVMLVIAGITLVENSFVRKKGTQNDSTNNTDDLEEDQTPTVDPSSESEHHESLEQEPQEQINQAQKDLDIQEYETKIVNNGLTQREIDEILREQLELNQHVKKLIATGKLDEVVNKMKADGVFAERITLDDIKNADDTGELEELLSKADEETLQEVYKTLTEQKTK
jgi:hypothetical protein